MALCSSPAQAATQHTQPSALMRMGKRRRIPIVAEAELPFLVRTP